MSCRKRVERAYERSEKLPLTRFSRYVLFSDCHRGAGTNNDNFLKNQHLFQAAAEYYYKNGFHYIELGDCEELWENRSVELIRNSHTEVYELFGCFQKAGRISRIIGNHDVVLRKELPEGIILENREGGRNMLLIHGHQADFFNYVCWRAARFMVRYFWKGLELAGVHDPTSAARNYKKAKKSEACLIRYAKENGIYLVGGHTHRPRLVGSRDFYLNVGSCVHPERITCIEIENMQTTLVKWQVRTGGGGVMYVKREVLAGPYPIE